MKITGFVKEKLNVVIKNKKYFDRQVALRRLSRFENEIDMVLTKYDKKTCNETMMVKGLRKCDEETTNRKIHQEDLEKIVIQIAKGIGLNQQIVGIMGKHHDMGHTFLGHSGEWWISNILEDMGLGYYCHNTLGARELIYTDQVYDEIIQKIKVHNPNVNEKVLSRLQKDMWLIIDGINAHNGERVEREYTPDLSKTEKDFKQEMICCYCKKGYDRKVVPASIEACLMRLADQISYIPLDMVDGIRNGLARDKDGKILTTLDDDYIDVLISLGITNEEIQIANASKNYTKIAERLKEVLINDVIANSTKKKITMSKQTMALMSKLRDLNNEKAVDNVILVEDQETYPMAIRKLIDRYAKVIIENELLDVLQKQDKESIQKLIDKYEGTPDETFIKFLCRINSKDYEFTKTIVEQATMQSIRDELNEARTVVQENQQYKEKEELGLNYDNKNARIRKYILYYQNKLQNGELIGYNDSKNEEEANTIMSHIKSSYQENYLNMEQRTAILIAAQYMSSLNDIEFLQLLRDTEIINEDQTKSLTRKYKDIEDLKGEVYIQSTWKNVSKAQKDTTNTLEIK